MTLSHCINKLQLRGIYRLPIQKAQIFNSHDYLTGSITYTDTPRIF